jgi:hypothetical protein
MPAGLGVGALEVDSYMEIGEQREELSRLPEQRHKGQPLKGQVHTKMHI